MTTPPPQEQAQCPRCGGHGSVWGQDPCSVCHGTGKVPSEPKELEWTTCHGCGFAELLPGLKYCSKCAPRFTVPAGETIPVAGDELMELLMTYAGRFYAAKRNGDTDQAQVEHTQAHAALLAWRNQAVAQSRREAEAVAQKERNELGAALKRSIDIMDAFSATDEGERK